MVMKRKIITVAAFILSTLFIESCHKIDAEKHKVVCDNKSALITKIGTATPISELDIERVISEYLSRFSSSLQNGSIPRELSFNDINMTISDVSQFVEYLSTHYDIELFTNDINMDSSIYSFVEFLYRLLKGENFETITSSTINIAGINLNIDFALTAEISYFDRDKTIIRSANQINSRVINNISYSYISNIKSITTNYKSKKGTFSYGETVEWNGAIDFTIAYLDNTPDRTEQWNIVFTLYYPASLITNSWKPTDITQQEQPSDFVHPVITTREEDLKNVVCEILKIDDISVSMDFSLDLNLDEATIIALYDMLYLCFGLEIDYTDIGKIRTFGDLFDEYNRQRGNFPYTTLELDITFSDYCQIIKDVLGYDGTISSQDRYVLDLGCDSLSLLEIVAAMEDEFDVDIPYDVAKMYMFRVQDLYFYLTK